METADCAIFLNGSYGVGKSAVLDHLGDLLAAAGRPFALMDVDWFHRSWPPVEGDVDNVLVEAEVMAATWAIYRRAGPRQLVLAGVIATDADRQRYQRALGLAVRSIRLEASPATRALRLRARYDSDRAAALDWHLQRHDHLARQLRAADLDEASIATDDLTPRMLAQQVLDHVDHHTSGAAAP